MTATDGSDDTEPRYAPPPYELEHAARLLTAKASDAEELLETRRAQLGALREMVGQLREGALGLKVGQAAVSATASAAKVKRQRRATQ